MRREAVIIICLIMFCFAIPVTAIAEDTGGANFPNSQAFEDHVNNTLGLGHGHPLPKTSKLSYEVGLHGRKDIYKEKLELDVGADSTFTNNFTYKGTTVAAKLTWDFDK